MGSQARVNEHQVTHFIRADITYNTTGIGGGKVVGHIPAGARIKPVESWVTTAFNAGTTNPINVGFITETDGLLDAAVANDKTQFAVVAGQTAGQAVASAPSGQNGVATKDLAVVIAYVPTGTDATAGAATIVIPYYPNL